MLNRFSRLVTLFLASVSLKRKVAELTGELNAISPNPAPRNRAERRMFAKKGHL